MNQPKLRYRGVMALLPIAIATTLLLSEESRADIIACTGDKVACLQKSTRCLSFPFVGNNYNALKRKVWHCNGSTVTQEGQCHTYWTSGCCGEIVDPACVTATCPCPPNENAATNFERSHLRVVAIGANCVGISLLYNDRVLRCDNTSLAASARRLWVANRRS